MQVDDQRRATAALPPGKTRYPLYMRLGGPPPGFVPRTVQPVANRYTDCRWMCACKIWRSGVYTWIFLTDAGNSSYVKGKVKVTLVQELRLCTGRTAHRGSRGIALPFHGHGTRRGEGSASRSGRSLPPGKTRYPLYRRLGGPQGRSGPVRKMSPLPGFHPRTVQPVASRYTDWATRPITLHGDQCTFLIKSRSVLLRTGNVSDISLWWPPSLGISAADNWFKIDVYVSRRYGAARGSFSTILILIQVSLYVLYFRFSWRGRDTKPAESLPQETTVIVLPVQK